MDIAALSMDMSQSSIMSKVSVAVLDKTMDTEKALGAGLVNMIDAAAMEQSVNPSVGASFDVRI